MFDRDTVTARVSESRGSPSPYYSDKVVAVTVKVKPLERCSLAPLSEEEEEEKNQESSFNHRVEICS